jgi:hypothetical protein
VTAILPAPVYALARAAWIPTLPRHGLADAQGKRMIPRHATA